MATSAQFLDHVGRKPRLQPQVVISIHEPSGTVGGGLWVLLIIEDADHHLNVALGLHWTAHHAKTHHRRAVPRHKGGDDRVEGTLATRDPIRMALCQLKTRAAILHRDPRPGDDDAGAEAHIVGLDERDHHPIRIGCGEVDGAVVDRQGRFWEPSSGHIDLLCPLSEEGIVNQGLRRHLHPGGIGDVAIGLGPCQLHRLDLYVDAVSSIHGVLSDLDMLQQAQGDEGCETLAIRRDLVKMVAAIHLRHRRHPDGLVGGQILQREQATRLAGVSHDALGQLTAVEGLPFRPGDGLQRGGLVGTCEALPGMWRLPLRQKRRCKGGIITVTPLGVSPHPRRDG